jgi:hypothetical protein
VRKPLRSRPTLEDVAREASVSLSTASYVLNNNTHAQRITEATKQRVRAAVNRQGYQFNPIGHACAAGLYESSHPADRDLGFGHVARGDRDGDQSGGDRAGF